MNPENEASSDKEKDVPGLEPLVPADIDIEEGDEKKPDQDDLPPAMPSKV